MALKSKCDELACIAKEDVQKAAELEISVAQCQNQANSLSSENIQLKTQIDADSVKFNCMKAKQDDLEIRLKECKDEMAVIVARNATLEDGINTVKKDLKKEKSNILQEYRQLTDNDVLLKHYQRQKQRHSSFEEVDEEEKNVLLKYHRQKLAE